MESESDLELDSQTANENDSSDRNASGWRLLGTEKIPRSFGWRTVKPASRMSMPEKTEDLETGRNIRQPEEWTRKGNRPIHVQKSYRESGEYDEQDHAIVETFDGFSKRVYCLICCRYPNQLPDY